MKHSRITLSVIFAVGMVLGGQLSKAQNAPAWKVDKAHTSVNFSINHFFSAVTGKFTSFDGSVFFDPYNVSASKVDFTIAVNSVNTDDKKRDNHLQSDAFFDAKKYPNITFVSTKIERQSDKQYRVTGILTIRDKTKEVSLPLRITGEMEHPMMKGTLVLGLVIETTLNRTDYGVGTGDWAATAVVGDEVRITIPMELNRKK